MSQQRMAGSQGFKQGMRKAGKGRGGSGRGERGGGVKGGARGQRGGSPNPHRETDNYQMQGSHLIGGGAYERQVRRESNSGGTGGGYGGGGYNGGNSDMSSIQKYINVSKSATQGNDDFSLDAANKFTNNTREQSNINKQQNAGFSDNRINNNSNFANSQQNKAFAKNEGFSHGVMNQMQNHANHHRAQNSIKSKGYANDTMNSYLQANRNNQTTNVGALDQTIRKAPLVDNAYSQVQGNNTYGDMYSYGRGGLPGYTQPSDPSKIEQPDFEAMSDKYINKIDDYKI